VAVSLREGGRQNIVDCQEQEGRWETYGLDSEFKYSIREYSTFFLCLIHLARIGGKETEEAA